MCTASWSARPGGYSLFFNRDERRTRLPALPPARREAAGGTPYLAPLDGDALGTWIAVNAHGVSLALLNGDAGDTGAPGPDAPLSRGHVIPRLADARSADEALERLAALPLERFRPLIVLALDRGGATTAAWDGDRLTTRAPVTAPLLSSSFSSEAVRASRLEVWNARRPDERGGDEAYRSFHRSHEPRRGPYSVCMHRPDARTVSFTTIHVDGGSVAMRYAPEAPCRGVDGPALRLD